MKDETETISTLTDDLLLTMQHLHPVMTALLAVLSRSGTEEKIAELTAVMERIATALEVQSRQLQTWEQRLAAQEPSSMAVARLSEQIDRLTRHLAHEASGRADLASQIGALSSLLEN